MISTPIGVAGLYVAREQIGPVPPGAIVRSAYLPEFGRSVRVVAYRPHGESLYVHMPLCNRGSDHLFAEFSQLDEHGVRE